ncbi:MAG: hypothetical protein C4325_00655 [Blastocatellia bacterium]
MKNVCGSAFEKENFIGLLTDAIPDRPSLRVVFWRGSILSTAAGHSRATILAGAAGIAYAQSFKSKSK